MTLDASQQWAATTTDVQRVAVVLWQPYEGIAQAISEALVQLGYSVMPFEWSQPLPKGTDVIFCYALELNLKKVLHYKIL